MPARITIRKRIDFNDVWWPGVLDMLVKRFALDFESADAALRNFIQRFKSYVNLHWFRSVQLDENENRIAACICECHGADIVTISLSKSIPLPAFLIRYAQAIEFEPRFRRGESELGKGTRRATIELSLNRRLIRLTSLRSVLLFHVLAILFSIVLYVAVVGLLFYGIAVFYLFLKGPVDFTIAATRHGSIGLALLSFLVAIAALSGKAVRNLIRDALNRKPGQKVGNKDRQGR